MKKLLLFIIISIVTLSAPKPSNNQNNKNVTELQFKIEQLEKRLENYEKLNWELERTQKDIDKLETKVDNKEGMVYNIDQIYSSANDFYKTSFDDLKTLMYQASGMILLILLGINYTNRSDLKEKKEEVEKIICEKMQELEEVKTKAKEIDNRLDELDKAFGLRLGELNKTFDKKMKDLEIKNIDLEAKLREFIEIEKEKIQKNLMEDYNTNVVCEIKNMKLKIQNMEEGSKSSEESEINIEPEGINTSDKIIRIIKKLYRKKEYSKAKEVLENNYSKDDYNMNYWLGLVNYKLLKYAEAIYHLNIAKNICPNEIKEYYVNYSLGMAMSKNKNYEGAIKYFHEAIKLAPKDSNRYKSYYQLGYTYSINLKYKEATIYLKEAEKYALTKEDKYNVYHELGVNYLFEVEYQLGIKYLQQAIQEAKKLTQSNKFKSLNWLGIAFCSTKEYLKAISCFNYVEKNQEYYSAFDKEWTAKCYYRLALEIFEFDQTKAKNYINKSLDYDPGNKEALELKEKIEKMPDNLDNKTEE